MAIAASKTPDLSSQAAAGAALRTFFSIAQAWQLSADESATLLGIPRSTMFRWKSHPPASLPRDALERLSLVFGIYKALQVLLPVPERADAWLRRPNDAPPFGGRPALDRLLSGLTSDLYVVRTYLDAQRGGWS
ncbi:MbcA/ParS/Xre antitoxin family protein [Pigmentiphaga soli]|uniref:MbcA/ParS/Xre antitoxin family protein n=1 Tax=Pigmentiphaga soli TaxID=1007095 RepID=A0ABP8H158_9BURK